jgi:hypothetical protein
LPSTPRPHQSIKRCGGCHRSLVQQAPSCWLRWRIEGPPRRRRRWWLHEAPPCVSTGGSKNREDVRHRIDEAPRRCRLRWNEEDLISNLYSLLLQYIIVDFLT